MLTQFVLAKEPVDAGKTIVIPGVSEIHALAENDAYATLLVLRGPDATFLRGTLDALHLRAPLVLSAQSSQGSLDPNFLS